MALCQRSKAGGRICARATHRKKAQWPVSSPVIREADQELIMKPESKPTAREGGDGREGLFTQELSFRAPGRERAATFQRKYAIAGRLNTDR